MTRAATLRAWLRENPNWHFGADILDALGLTECRPNWSNALRTLVEIGCVERQGPRNAARYRYVREPRREARGGHHATQLHGHCAEGLTYTYQTWLRLRSARTPAPRNWARFPQFLADMGERQPGWRIARLDLDKPHGPDNSYWKRPDVANTERSVAGSDAYAFNNGWAKYVLSDGTKLFTAKAVHTLAVESGFVGCRNLIYRRLRLGVRDRAQLFRSANPNLAKGTRANKDTRSRKKVELQSAIDAIGPRRHY